MKKIYITGISGTGKSAISKELKKRNIFSFDIDEINGLCQWVIKDTQRAVDNYIPSKEWLETHDWICDIEKLKKLLSQYEEDVIVTGVAGNQEKYLSLFDNTFLLKCDKDTILQRLKQRQIKGGNRFGEHQEERDYVVRMFSSFNQELLDKGAIPVNANDSINTVVDSIVSRITS